MNYEEWTDDEINAAVAGIRCELKIGDFGVDGWCKNADYCNDPADAMPIIITNGISVIKHSSEHGMWMACNNVDFQFIQLHPVDDIGADSFNADNSTHHENPYRCAMIVFLKMKASESLENV